MLKLNLENKEILNLDVIFLGNWQAWRPLYLFGQS